MLAILLRPWCVKVKSSTSGLLDEKGRLQIVNIHTIQIRDNEKLAPDVDLGELARERKNFSGAEIEGLVRAATATAMNRLIKVTIWRTIFYMTGHECHHE